MAKSSSSKKSAKSLKKHKSVFEHPPQKNVLLLSCMDVRLLDNTVHFMDDMNLQNRYDQVVFAGAGLGAGQLWTLDESQDPPVKAKWKAVFFDHLQTAINGLKRDIKDIFILEHLDCGAYKKLHPDGDVRKNYEKYAKAGEYDKLKKIHLEAANKLADEIDEYCDTMKRKPATPDFDPSRWEDIKVRCLIMDLFGFVEDLV